MILSTYTSENTEPDSLGNRDARNSPEVTSSSSGLTVTAGFIGLISAFILLRIGHDWINRDYIQLIIVISGIAIPIFLVDMTINKVHRRESTGLDFSNWRPDPLRSLTKFIGLSGSLAIVYLAYWLFPEYQGEFYVKFFHFAGYIMPIFICLSIPYIYFVDGLMKNPRDGYWQFGMAILMRWELIDRRILLQHLLGCIVKGFFLPLMLADLAGYITNFVGRDLTRLDSFQTFYNLSFDSLYMIDVAFGSIGYIFALRLTDTHIRSVETTVKGWLVALICYAPFWYLLGNHYLSYRDGRVWGEWLRDYPIAYCVWGSLILVLTGIYVWSTIMFGCRFSNLTNRGIITNGPYRLTKHPAYLSKNISWWLISVPFLSADFSALRSMILLLMLNAIYFLRAKTEEQHLSTDPAYRAYAAWIDQHGLFSRLYRVAAQKQ